MARADTIDDLIRDEMQRQRIPGLSLSVVRDGKPVREQGYGLADTQRQTPATSATIFEIGSLTKQFTAMAILILTEEGKVRLDDPLMRYKERIPTALPPTWRNVTLRQLLNHMSGIPSYTSVLSEDELNAPNLTSARILKAAAEKPLDFAPGTTFAYSNTGYYLLGLVIEKAGGTSYRDFLTDRIFRPLGMKESDLSDPSVSNPHRATGYAAGKPVPPIAPMTAYAAGAIVSTVRDMAKWDAALSTEKLVRKSSLRAMETPGRLSDGTVTHYGFGWIVGSLNGHRLLAHDGGTMGFTSSILRFPEDRLTVILLANTADAEPGKITFGVAGLLNKALALPPEKPLAAIEDKEPTVTALVRDTITRIAGGTLKPDPFDAKMRSLLFPEAYRRLSAQIDALGPIQSMVLLERSDASGLRSYRYHVVFAHGSLNCLLALNGEGKISGLLLTPQ